MMQWRQEFLRGVTPSAADVAAEAATGKAVLHSHKDVNGRPVIIIRASRHITGQALRIAAHVPHSVPLYIAIMRHVRGLACATIPLRVIVAQAKGR